MMDIQRLTNSDLNLLVTFQVLMEEKSVTRAAARLFISQPAMSKSLKRLRILFNDPLFTRTAYGLSPTPRADALQKEIPGLLDKVEQIICNEDFQIETYSGCFRIACSEAFAYILPALLTNLAQQAPAVKIEHLPLANDYEESLRNGKLDFVIHRALIPKPDIVIDKLDTLGLACLMRAGHPLKTKKRLSIDDYLAYSHVRIFIPNITASGLGLVDEMLAKQNLQRQINFETPYLQIALNVVENTDYLALIASPFNTQNYKSDAFRVVEMPKELSLPARQLELLHHSRSSLNPAHKWLRQLIVHAV